MNTRGGTHSPINLHGSRLVLRTLGDSDYASWHEVRRRCHDWLVKWEPRSAHAPYLAEDERSFSSRCAIRERERQMGTGVGFGLRFEGIAERYLEIDGAWEDHARYAITAEEWADRAPQLVADWLLPRTA